MDTGTHFIPRANATGYLCVNKNIMDDKKTNIRTNDISRNLRSSRPKSSFRSKAKSVIRKTCINS